MERRQLQEGAALDNLIGRQRRRLQTAHRHPDAPRIGDIVRLGETDAVLGRIFADDNIIDQRRRDANIARRQ